MDMCRRREHWITQRDLNEFNNWSVRIWYSFGKISFDMLMIVADQIARERFSFLLDSIIWCLSIEDSLLDTTTKMICSLMNTGKLLFIYRIHFNGEIRSSTNDRRFDGSWFFSTTGLFDSFIYVVQSQQSDITHSLIIGKMNKHQCCCVRRFLSIEYRCQLVSRERKRTNLMNIFSW